jgi:hypothetical protein
MTTVEVRKLSKRQARKLTDEIKSHAETLWGLLVEMYEGQGWKALGYKTWGAYVEAELSVTRQHSYMILDQARVVKELVEATDVSDASDISMRDAQVAKAEMSAVVDDVQEAKAEGASDADAVRTGIAKARERLAAEPSDLVRRLTNAAEGSGGLAVIRPHVKFQCQEIAQLLLPHAESHPEWCEGVWRSTQAAGKRGDQGGLVVLAGDARRGPHSSGEDLDSARSANPSVEGVEGSDPSGPPALSEDVGGGSDDREESAPAQGWSTSTPIEEHHASSGEQVEAADASAPGGTPTPVPDGALAPDAAPTRAASGEIDGGHGAQGEPATTASVHETPAIPEGGQGLDRPLALSSDAGEDAPTPASSPATYGNEEQGHRLPPEVKGNGFRPHDVGSKLFTWVRSAPTLTASKRLDEAEAAVRALDDGERALLAAEIDDRIETLTALRQALQYAGATR